MGCGSVCCKAHNPTEHPDVIARLGGTVVFDGTHIGMSLCTWCERYLCEIGNCNENFLCETLTTIKMTI